MCDGGVDEITEVQLDSWLKAAKERLCIACRESIPAGIIYHQSRRLVEGSWEVWSHCVRCWRMCEALWQRNGGECIDMRLSCGEVWDSPPEAVAELAFALPGDMQKEPAEERDRELARMRRVREYRRRATAQGHQSLKPKP